MSCMGNCVLRRRQVACVGIVCPTCRPHTSTRWARCPARVTWVQVSGASTVAARMGHATHRFGAPGQAGVPVQRALDPGGHASISGRPAARRLAFAGFPRLRSGCAVYEGIAGRTFSNAPLGVGWSTAERWKGQRAAARARRTSYGHRAHYRKSATWTSKDAGVTGIHFALFHIESGTGPFHSGQEARRFRAQAMRSEQFRAVNVLT